MKRKMKVTRMAAFLLALTLLFNNESMMYALASSANNPSNISGDAEGGSGGGNTSEGGEEGGGNTSAGGDEGGGNTSVGGDEGDDNTSVGGEEGDDNTSVGGDEGDGNTSVGGDEGDGNTSEGGEEGGGNTSEGGEEGGDSTSEGGEEEGGDASECEHEWVTDQDTLLTVCAKCGIEKKENNDEDISSGAQEECEHEWVTDPDTLLTVCAKCGIEKKENVDEDISGSQEECEHEWIRDPETLNIICNKCGGLNLEEEAECPEGGFHIWQANEEGTGYICALCGALKESLDPLDVTMEMYINATSGEMAVLTVTDADDPASSNLPKTLAELEALSSKELIVDSLGDLLVVQKLSTETDFEGYTIKMAQRSLGDLSATPPQSTYTWDLQNTAFTGLGDEAHPFSGIFMSGYTAGLNYIVDKPFFKYLSTDAQISDMNIVGAINTQDNNPQGIIASVLVRRGENSAELVKMNNVVLDGSVSNTKGAAGMVFGRVDASMGFPISLSFDSSAVKLCQKNEGTVSGLHAGAVAGETLGDVTLTVTDPSITGKTVVKSVTKWENGDNENESGKLGCDTTSAAGMYAGAMQGGTLTIAGNSTPYTVNVQNASGHGGANGGFVGMAIGTKVAVNAAADNQITLEGAGVKGRISGGILGYYDHDTEGDLQLNYITVSAPISRANDDSYFSGGILGRYYRNEDGAPDKNFDTIDHVTVNSEVSANYFAGGVVGFVHGSNLRIGGTDEESVNITGKVTNPSAWGTEGNACGAGGVVGLISGQYVEIQNTCVKTTFHQNAFATGGIVGAVGKIKPGFIDNGRKSIIKITNALVDSTSFGCEGPNSARARGGLLGMVYEGNMVSLDGTIDVTGMNLSRTIERFGRTGWIAGGQKESLIYLEESASYQRPESKTWVGSDNNGKGCLDDIGNYGGVYQNGPWGTDATLISYASAQVQGEVSKDGSTWVIDSEADFIRLAIMLNSQGNFAANCFQNTSKADLLKADYLVTKSLNLAGSGVYSLNRNDSTGMNELFSGSFKGTGSTQISIDLGELKTRQSYVALFPGAGDGAEFSGFTLKRTIDGASLYAAGIACQALGNFKAQDITIDLTLRSFYGGKEPVNGTDLYNMSHYYGGLVGKVESGGATSFTVDSVKVGGTWTGSSNTSSMIMGGMIADYAQTGTAPSVISVNGFELMGNFKLTTAGRTASGMITQLNSRQGVVTGTGINKGMNLESTKLSMCDIIIHDGASITENYTGIGTDNAGGGWLGLTWKNVIPDDDVHYSVDGITIGDGGTAEAGPEFTTKGFFGGLVDTVTGRIQLKDINIQNGIFNGGSKNGTGLLFRVGNDAFIEIDGYTIGGRKLGNMDGANNGGAVQIKGAGMNFDEIVACNIGATANNETHNYQTGGIVNIIYDGFSNSTSAEHKTYQNRLLEADNGGTRYYYNLLGNSFAGEDSYLQDSEKLTNKDAEITNEKQMMIWHLSQYMNNSVRGYLQPYYTENINNDLRNQDTVFKGTIDLEKVSYYPTPVLGGDYTFGEKAEIIFYGEDITDKATETMTPSSESKEHYMMHAGLFLSQTGAVTVQGTDAGNFLTLSGSVTNLGANSGALFCRDIAGKKNIYRVRMEGLSLANYKGEHPAGLLIGIVKDDSSLDLSWIETEGYEKFNGKKAASALIARVGTPQASRISIEFKNIKVDSRKNGIFQYASLIDENYYVETTSDLANSFGDIRRIRYLFTKSAFLGEDNGDKTVFPFDGSNPYYGNDQYDTTGSYVTIGSELSEGIEYWDVTGGPEDNKNYDLPFNDNFIWTFEETGTVNDTYLPYVHTSAHQGSKEIEVNPKNVSIKQGCGTYEDPYIIDSAKQLLALARYLQNKNDYKYLGGWQINKYQSGRNGGVPCDKNHPDTDLMTYPEAPTNGVVNLPKGFPTQEELCQAYYMITGNIDLSAMSNATDRQIAEDFVGLGTENIPFRGVIVGQKLADSGQYPTITLPLRSNWTDNTADVNHGLVQYAKGAVVKDLKICGASDVTDRTGTARVRDMAGGVIACVLGGDNIIDNVSVKLQVALTGTSCQAGAYVGNVKQGSVILRNLKAESAREFQAGTWGDNKFTAFEEKDLSAYPYVSGLIGKVEDGCVIYDDTFNGGSAYSKVVLAHDETKIENGANVLYDSNQSLPICKHYDIPVKSKLGSADQITVTNSLDGNRNNQFTAQVNDAAGLQIVSMAINSDAFSVYYKEGGYNEDAACRKARYCDVGSVTASNQGEGSDFKAATTEDDEIYYYPWIYQYFDFRNTDGSDGRKETFKTVTDNEGHSGYISRLNAATEEITDVMTYQLKSGEIYDLSVYDRGFRGLGATYGMHTLSQNGEVSSDVLNGSFYSDFRANFDGQGATIRVDIDRTYDSSIHTAALFNDLLDRSSDETYTIKNITVTGKVVSVEHVYDANKNEITGNSAYPNRTSAVIGFMRRPWNLSNITVNDMIIEAQGHAGGIVAWIEPESGKTLEFKFENCSVSGKTQIDSYGGSVGGIIGVMTQNGVVTEFEKVSLNLKDCTVTGALGSEVKIAVQNRTQDRTDADNNGNYKNNQLAVGRSGGLIGYIGRRFLVGYEVPSVHVTVEDSAISYAEITGAYSTGGFIGEYDTVQTDKTTPSTVEIQSAQVENCRIEGTRSNQGTSDDWFNFGVGGIIGEMKGYSLEVGMSGTGGEVIVKDTDVISSALSGNGMYAGGVVGCLKTKEAELTQVRVQGAIDSAQQASLELGGQQYTIKSGRSDAGGVIGRAVSDTTSEVPELTMSDIQVSGMNIAGDDRATDFSIFATGAGATGRAGGIIGTNQMKLTIETADANQTDGGAIVDSCMITVSYANAGGIVGVVDRCSGSNTIRSTDIQNVKVINSIIGYTNIKRFLDNDTSVGAGGVYGKIFSGTGTIYHQHHLENAQISNCWIYGPSAGGVLGYGSNYAQLYSNEIDPAVKASVNINNNVIYGMQVGGVIGYCESSAVNYIGTNIEGNCLQAYRNAGNSAAYAGGFCGNAGKNGAAANYRLDFITIKNNHILGANLNTNKRIGAGGFFGYANWSNCYVYQPELTDNLIGYSKTDNGGDFLDKNESPGIQTLQTLFNSTTGEIGGTEREVSLITGATNSLKAEKMPTVAEIRSKGIGYYAAQIGNFIGVYGTNAHTYFLAPVVSYSSADITTRPVIDVGMAAGTGTVSDSLLGAPYAYRKNIHIIYHEPESTPDKDAQVWSNAVIVDPDNKLGTTDGEKCLFSEISYQGIMEAYRDAKTTTELSEYLEAYRLGIKADGTETIEEVYQKLYRKDDGSLVSALKLGTETLPVIVLDTQYGTADQLIKGVVAALTGVGGVYSDNDATYSNGMKAVTRITTTPMKISGNTISVDSRQPSLSASSSSGKWTIEYRDYDDDGYDLDNNFSGTQTFTMLTITYSWSYETLGNKKSVTRSEVIRIPIFVVERLTIDTHLKIIEDLVYNAEKVKDEGVLSSKVVVANDSSYTLYTEYIYGNARKKYDTSIEKHIGTYAEENGVKVNKGFAAGTKLTLIDVDGGNKVYYYTVKEGDTGPIPYSAFTDENGVNYSNKMINQDDGFIIVGENDTYTTTDMEQSADGGETAATFKYSNVAVERFLITVDISGVSKEDRIGSEIRILDSSPEITDALEPKTTLTEHTNLQTTIQPGMTIEFTGKNETDQEEKTWIEGNIKASEEEGFVNIWAAIDIKADPFYWTAVAQNGANTIDSANNNKYLELQIYMATPGSDQEISLPAGTNVSIEGVRTKPEGIYVDGVADSIPKTNLDPYYNTSNIYFYKDGKLQFKLNDLSKLIQAETEKNNTTEGVVRWVDQLTLDFRNADMTPYDKEQYTMHLNLLRTEDPDYPVGGEILDTYERDLPAARKQDLACAVETRDLMQLGVNTYENQTRMPHQIDFDFKLDFNGILTGNDATDIATTDKRYTVVYRLLQKTNVSGTPQYIPYNGDQLTLELVEDPNQKILTPAVSANKETKGMRFWYVDYVFDWQEIKDGTLCQTQVNGVPTETQNKGVVVRSLKLTVQDASQMDLSNYKVQAIVYVNDNDAWEIKHEELDLNSITPLTDFFVFTVAKLKTDLDY